MPAALWDLNPDWLIKVLASVGGAALGALSIGALAQLIAQAAFKQRVPPWPLAVVRALGGLVCGLLVWSLLGPSLGRGKGPGEGPGSGPGKRPGAPAKSIPDGKSPQTDKTAAPTEKAGWALMVEVLGDDPLREIARKQGGVVDKQRRYRITEGGKKVLKTREEIEKIIQEGHASQTAPLTALTIKVYQDSPERGVWVIPLEQFAAKKSTKEKPLKVVQEIESSYAPID